jgi:hypothetical protein
MVNPSPIFKPSLRLRAAQAAFSNTTSLLYHFLVWEGRGSSISHDKLTKECTISMVVQVLGPNPCGFMWRQFFHLLAIVM